MRFLWILPLVLAGCTLEALLPDGDLQVGTSVIVDLPAARPEGGGLRPGSRTYRLRVEGGGTFQVAAISSVLQERSRLRLTLYDAQGVVQAQSVARNWFGLPQVALASVRPQGLTTDLGYRLNFRAPGGSAFYLKVENLAEAPDRVTLYLDPFTPNPSGQGEAFNTGSRTGAIELLGEFDRYDVSAASGYLRLGYSGPLDLVALLYLSPSDPNPVRLDPVLSCAPVSPAVLLVVRDRALARAGFDEENSGRYTLSLSNTPCP
ncbi:hypothetical protein [Thermus filiformis]|uniref:Uncharacterized protein n=1 Tax=Thermus filiformis TaxID=276 RepID=A0A0A2WTB2_THEFI|nr:hypothetical protein [Thermus filiformis]KGQ23048.1 hypothetical protein THFILI_05070 [Thermus filiformis]